MDIAFSYTNRLRLRQAKGGLCFNPPPTFGHLPQIPRA